MKYLLSTIALGTFAACAMPIASGSALETIMGKQLLDGADFVVINADGTMRGMFGGETLTGVWRSENGLFCRSGTLGVTPIPDACQTIDVAGNVATFTRTDGNNRVTTYTIAP